MGTNTDRFTPDERVAVTDYLAAARSELAYDEESGSSGWTWIAAILIAALFIVSGYLDQESGMFESSATQATGDKYASNSSAPQAPTISVAREKGY